MLLLGGRSPGLAEEPFQYDLRLLTMNVYGSDEIEECECAERGERVGDYLAQVSPPYDVAALQEFFGNADFGWYTCESYLYDAAKSTGRYPDDTYTELFTPTGEWWELELDGGIGSFSLHPIEEDHEYEWDEQADGWEPLQGLLLTRVPMPVCGLTVDVYNIHVLARGADGCDLDCQLGQVEELREQIALKSWATGNPVVVMGDFNIYGHRKDGEFLEEYLLLLAALGYPQDVWLSAHPDDPGYTSNCKENITCQCAYSDYTSQERIDYIFVIDDPELTTSPYELRVADPSEVNLIKLKTAGGRDASDHYGLEARLEVRGYPTVWTATDAADGGEGTPGDPFDSINAAASAACVEGRVMMGAGTYSESVVLDMPIRLESSGGLARIVGE